ncbi:MAG: molybdopterin-dependent oxidoreductase [Gammaproteobacteria bacterium]|nr:molybdopterin-dependent oxidoreductase [Gammaproteobacteria bacterium]
MTRCSIIGYVENERLVKIEGHPDATRNRGKICAKGQAGVNQVYDPDRVLYPLRRVGARGEGKWKRISWDEALTELAERLGKLREEGQPEKFMFHYGRMKASSSKLIKSVFLPTYGTGTIGNHTSICEGGKWTGQELTWGAHYDNWDFENTQYVLNFGSNVLEAHTNHIPEAERLIRMISTGRTRMVTFDVRLSNTAARSDEWQPIRPGTDLAVVLAMCNVIMSEELYRTFGEEFLDFVKANAGANASREEKIRTLASHLGQYSPEWAEKESGVAADDIRRIAREVATHHPAAIISYRGAVAHYRGAETERAIQMLAALTGNIDNPGGRCKAVAPSWHYSHGPEDKPESRKLDILDGFDGQVAFPTHHVSNQIFNMIRDGSKGRPEVYLWYCYQPVYSNGDCKANEAVLKDESLLPFTVCSSPFYDESAALADMILPDATYLERWDWEDMVNPSQFAEYYIRQPMVEPLGEARDLADVFCELAERMGMPLGFDSKEEFVRMSCEMTPGVREAGGFDYMREKGVWHDPDAKPRYYSYREKIPAKELAADGVILDEATGVYWNWKKSKAHSEAEAQHKGYSAIPKAYEGYVGQRIGDQVYRGFPPDKLNKSGYFELYSELMAEAGFNPLPTYEPIPEHQDLKDDQLILTTYKVNVQTHSRTQNCKWLSEIYHENPAWLNPATAQTLGVRNGESVRLRSSLGELETPVRVTPAVAPGVIAISNHCGHWQYGRYASGKLSPWGGEDPEAARAIPAYFKGIWWEGNHGVHPNWLIPNRPDPDQRRTALDGYGGRTRTRSKRGLTRSALTTAEEARGSSRLYGLLANVFWSEPDESLLQQLASREVRALLEEQWCRPCPPRSLASTEPARARARALAMEFTRLFVGPGQARASVCLRPA